MQTADQSAVVAFLSQPSTHGGAAVDRLETHASIVILAGQRAYKLKRAVRFDYLDFSTAERRRHMCEAEVRLNQRTAPAIYRGVVPVTRSGVGLRLGGDGEPIDWLVEMNRFDQQNLFDRLAVTGRLGLDLMAPLASAIAGFHASAEPRTDLGGKAGMAWVIEGNADGFAEFGRDCLDPPAVATLTEDSWAALHECEDLLEDRRESSFVRQCHGDLHLRNIVLLDGRPTLFDGVEFNDQISCVDVFYDLAFVLIDLWRRRLPAHANAVFNRYLIETGDVAGAGLLPLFLACRAAVRAKTSATAAAQVQGDEPRRRELQATAREYLTMAGRLLHPPRACLVAVGGLSGSGKTTLALSLAPEIGAAPGAVVLRSDELRKQLAGVPVLQPLGAEGYTTQMSERVYRTLSERASSLLRSGHSVIVDAVHARPADRKSIEAIARAASVPFVGLWLDAPESLLVSRTDQRRDDASDANPELVHRQLTQSTGPIEWARIDASGSPSSVLSNARDHVRSMEPEAAPLRTTPQRQ